MPYFIGGVLGTKKFQEAFASKTIDNVSINGGSNSSAAVPDSRNDTPSKFKTTNTTSNNINCNETDGSKSDRSNSNVLINNSIAESSEASQPASGMKPPKDPNARHLPSSSHKRKSKKKHRVTLISPPSFYDDSLDAQQLQQNQQQSNHTRESTVTDTSSSDVGRHSNSTITSTSSLNNTLNDGGTNHKYRSTTPTNHQHRQIPVIEEEIEQQDRYSRKPWTMVAEDNKQSNRRGGNEDSRGSLSYPTDEYLTHESRWREAPDDYVDPYPDLHQQSSSGTNNSQGRRSNNQQQRSSWDSDGQFSAMEMDRIKNKTLRLKTKRMGTSSTNKNKNAESFHIVENELGFDNLDAVQYMQQQQEMRQQESEAKRIALEQEQMERKRRFQSHRKKIEEAYSSSNSTSTGDNNINNYGGSRSNVDRGGSSHYGDDNKSAYTSNSMASGGRSVRVRRPLHWGKQQKQQQQANDQGTSKRSGSSSLGRIVLENDSDQMNQQNHHDGEGIASYMVGTNRSADRQEHHTNKGPVPITPSGSGDKKYNGSQYEQKVQQQQQQQAALSKMNVSTDSAKTSDLNTSEETIYDDRNMLPTHTNASNRQTSSNSNPDQNRAQHNPIETNAEIVNEEDDDGAGDIMSDIDYTVHDLCGEATVPEDIAWRNALYLTAVQPAMASLPTDDGNHWLPLHISVMDVNPPPPFIIRAFLYANPDGCSTADDGGRLPLHLLAASSADTSIMQMLVDIYPDAVRHRDHHGFIPLHLFLLNRFNRKDKGRKSQSFESIQDTIEQVKILLGLTANPVANQFATQLNNSNSHKIQKNSNMLLQRRYDHWDIPVQELHKTMKHNYNRRPVTKFNRDITFEVNPEEWKRYPTDVQASLRKLANWRYKEEIKKQQSKHQMDESIEIRLFGENDNDENSLHESLDTRDPACIPTPGTNQLPIHIVLEQIIKEGNKQRPKKTKSAFFDEDSESDDNESDDDEEKVNNKKLKTSGLEGDGSQRENEKQSDKKTLLCQSQKVDHSDSIGDTEGNGNDHPAQKEDSPVYGIWISILRLLVAVGPEALIMQDSCGLTPLLQLLLAQNYYGCSCNDSSSPTFEIVELLLGKRSVMYSLQKQPSWSTDVPLHRQYLKNNNASRNLGTLSRVNPAMIAHPDNQQLPLHIAADELQFLPNDTYYSIVRTIHESYPAAITVQDWKGRTPLHLALHSFQTRVKGQYPPDRRVLDTLLSDGRVARIVDDYGNIPFDLLLDNAHLIPVEKPECSYKDQLLISNDEMSSDTAKVFQKLFGASLSLMTSKRPKQQANEGIDLEQDDIRRELLRRLRVLPHWIRTEACTSSFVKNSILDELARPWNTAFVVLDGLLLGALIIVYRLDMDNFVDHVKVVDVDTMYPTWYTYAVYCTASSRLIYQVVYASLASSVGEFYSLCGLNIWFCLDMLTMLFSIASSVLVVDGTRNEDSLLQLGTACTGLLWFCVLGYLKKWWYGMAIFVGGISRIVSRLLPGFIGACIFLLAFAEMFYTRFQSGCIPGKYLDALDDTYIVAAGLNKSSPVCTVRESYQAVYQLARGDNSLVLTRDVDGNELKSTDSIVMTTVFLVILIVFIIAFVVSVFFALSTLNYDAIGREYFWEPNLTFIIATIGDGITQKTQGRQCSTKLGDLWEPCMRALNSHASHNIDWTKRPFIIFQIPIIGTVVAMIVVPTWLLAGTLTLGLLWPPQVRRCIFGSRIVEYDELARSSERTVDILMKDLREEVHQLKLMSFDRSSDVEREIIEIKNILHTAMNEE